MSSFIWSIQKTSKRHITELSRLQNNVNCKHVGGRVTDTWAYKSSSCNRQRIHSLRVLEVWHNYRWDHVLSMYTHTSVSISNISGIIGSMMIVVLLGVLHEAVSALRKFIRFGPKRRRMATAYSNSCEQLYSVPPSSSGRPPQPPSSSVRTNESHSFLK